MKRTPRKRQAVSIEEAFPSVDKVFPGVEVIGSTNVHAGPGVGWTPGKAELTPHVRVDGRVTATVPWNKPELVTLVIRHEVKPPRAFRVDRDPDVVLAALIDEEVSIAGKNGRELLVERIAPLF